MIWINVLGGIAVLGSYAYGLTNNPDARGALWGGVPVAVRPLYTVSMFLAAVGYFPFTYFLLFHVDPERARIGGRFRFALFNVLYLLILVPSALWLPLTFMMIARPSHALWCAIRVVLALVGVGSVALIVALTALRPREFRLLYVFAIAGAIAFSIQTALLDALIWPAYFDVAPGP